MKVIKSAIPILILLLGLLMLFLLPSRSIVVPKSVTEEREKIVLEEFPPIRLVAETGILGDIDSHLPRGHLYGDPDDVTFVHEGTHGINSYLRNKNDGKPCFYILDNDYLILPELDTTLKGVEAMLPVECRGRVFNLYVVEQQRYWNGQPSYLFDELVAYVNGCLMAKELQLRDDNHRSEFARELFIYSLCAIKNAASKDKMTRQFMLMMDDVLEPVDFGPLLPFAEEYFGENWAKNRKVFLTELNEGK